MFFLFGGGVQTCIESLKDSRPAIPFVAIEGVDFQTSFRFSCFLLCPQYRVQQQMHYVGSIVTPADRPSRRVCPGVPLTSKLGTCRELVGCWSGSAVARTTLARPAMRAFRI